ncbi:SURF1 family protein [Carbonactinospora thermoautotrophica]|uniref:SURF1 family cytochrome oxidase biogenesis protein n=1 Tax=Carbonactinospora thermoautotrophica TaxID=1469144 RepID=UPI000A67E602|nr:SURF1 family protein [Carbonactinospora thermoautotrophica]
MAADPALSGGTGEGTVRDVYRFLLAPRWLAFHLLVLIVIPTFVSLGLWQLDRLHQRRERNQLIEANVHATPVPVDRLLAPGRPVPRQDEWRPVTTTGRYDPRHQLLVRNRSLKGRAGFWVLTPLVTGDGTALLVNRGWVPLAGTAREAPPVPEPPAGEVQVTGRVRRAETPESTGRAERSGLPPGQVTLVDVPRIAQDLPYPVYGGYVELADQRPPAGDTPKQIPEPELSEGPHLAYAVQWFLFAAFAPVGWFALVRREAEQRPADVERV